MIKNGDKERGSFGHQKGETSMKKLFILIICTFGMIPTMVNAHTEFTSSNPATGQVVTEDLTEIVLTFAGEIESLSTMNVMKDGQEIPLNVELQEKQMTGTLSTPLDNGSYVINWNIAGKDGHLITGEIPFTVQMEQKAEPKAETNEPAITEKEKMNETQTKNNRTNVQATNSIKIIVPIVVVLMLVTGLFLLFGRKK
jgi:copper resistance protein C